MSSRAYSSTSTASFHVAPRPYLARSRRFRGSQKLWIPLKFITNTTRRPRRRVVEDLLARLGLQVALEDVYTPAAIAHDLLAQRKLTPFLVVHPDLREDFSGLATDTEEVCRRRRQRVLHLRLIEPSLSKIYHGAQFFALATNRNFLDHDFELSLDAGPFVMGLEYASGRRATVLGKPGAGVFQSSPSKAFRAPPKKS